MRGGLLGTKLITLCEMNQKLNQSVSLRAVGWLLRQHGGVIPPSTPSFFHFFFFFYSLSILFHHSLLLTSSTDAFCPFSPSSVTKIPLSFLLTSCFSFSFPFLFSLSFSQGLREHLLLANRDITKSSPPPPSLPPACAPGSHRQNDSFYYSS